jgi:hypothetical protein
MSARPSLKTRHESPNHDAFFAIGARFAWLDPVRRWESWMFLTREAVFGFTLMIAMA